MAPKLGLEIAEIVLEEALILKICKKNLEDFRMQLFDTSPNEADYTGRIYSPVSG